MRAEPPAEGLGRLIVLEGIDGSGKTSVARSLVDHLETEGVSVQATREPTESVVGQAVRQALADPDHEPVSEALLFAADHAAHVAQIRHWLADGQVVVSDRYSFSCLAYQGASLVSSWPEEVEVEPLAWLEWVLDPFEHPPDLTLLLDLPVERAMERLEDRGEGPEKFEKESFLRQVRDNYLALAKAHDFVTVDAAGSVDEVTEAALGPVRELLGGRL